MPAGQEDRTMASPRKSGDERLVSRTYRAAIRIGEDFITLEETIALPLDASDDEVAQAVELGWRIYRAQREETAGSNGAASSGHQAEGSPINDKQIHALERLAQQHGLDLDAESRRRFGVVVHGLTFDQASALLREWQRPAQTRRAAGEP